MEISRLTRDGTAEPVSRDQILRHARGQGNINFPCSADHEQDWQPCPVDPYSAICDDHTYIHTYMPMYDLGVVSSSRSADCDFTGHLYLKRITCCLVAFEVAVLGITRCIVVRKKRCNSSKN